MKKIIGSSVLFLILGSVSALADPAANCTAKFQGPKDTSPTSATFQKKYIYGAQFVYEAVINGVQFELSPTGPTDADFMAAITFLASPTQVNPITASEAFSQAKKFELNLGSIAIGQATIQCADPKTKR